MADFSGSFHKTWNIGSTDFQFPPPFFEKKFDIGIYFGYGQIALYKGASVKYVFKIFGIFDPPSPLSAFHSTYPYYSSKITRQFSNPLPPQFGCT